MNVEELTALVDEFNYILARISKYLKNNQYVYLRAFESWKDGYNLIAARLNAEKILSVPIFKLSPVDFSPTGKSMRQECVRKFVKTITHQVARLEDKISELNKAAEANLARRHSLERFFHHDADGALVEPLQVDNRIFIATPAGDAEMKLFWRGIQPALEMHGLSFFHSNQPQLDDAALCEVGQELHACRLAIVNLTGQAPNVMLVLGLAYGIGKPIIVLQQQEDPELGAKINNGYVRYAGAADLKTSLSSRLSQLLRS